MSTPRPIVHHGDCLAVLRTLPDASVDAVVTDPPYGLSNTDPKHVAETLTKWVTGDHEYTPPAKGGFMGKTWDSFVPPPAVWDECMRVLKPGGHLLVFAGTRTQDLMGLSIRLAGFEIRDSLAWIYGQGFNKGGMLGNRKGIKWCDCGENPVPYTHADNADMPRVRTDLHPTAVSRGEGQDTVLLPTMQRAGEGPGVGEARAQGPSSVDRRDLGEVPGVDRGAGQPLVEGRHLHRAGQGVPDGTPTGSPAGEGERVRGRASAGDGGDGRASGGAARGGAPHQRESVGQPAGEPETVRGSSEPLGDRAPRVGGRCARCGGLDPAYRGYGTALKPAIEPVIVARKPIRGTVAANVLAHGTGGINVDGCRVGEGGQLQWSKPRDMGYYGGSDVEGSEATANTQGRFPPNVLLDPEAAAAMDEQSGVTGSNFSKRKNARKTEGVYGEYAGDEPTRTGPSDTGGASRFFPVFKYQAKAPAKERPQYTAEDGRGVKHATVKPLELMRWLVRLVTPAGGVILDPFAGSGTTGEAAMLEGFDSILIEGEAEHLPLIDVRIDRSADDTTPPAPEPTPPTLHDRIKATRSRAELADLYDEVTTSGNYGQAWLDEHTAAGVAHLADLERITP